MSLNLFVQCIPIIVWVLLFILSISKVFITAHANYDIDLYEIIKIFLNRISYPTATHIHFLTISIYSI